MPSRPQPAFRPRTWQWTLAELEPYWAFLEFTSTSRALLERRLLEHNVLELRVLK